MQTKIDHTEANDLFRPFTVPRISGFIFYFDPNWGRKGFYNLPEGAIKAVVCRFRQFWPILLHLETDIICSCNVFLGHLHQKRNTRKKNIFELL